MRVFIAGVDGYLGWSLANHLTAMGHDVGGADMFFRRRWVEEMGSTSAIPIAPIEERLKAFKRQYGKELDFWCGDLRDYSLVQQIFREFKPDAVVHLGECPSAPFSMIDVHHAVFVQTNNITTTFNLIFAIRDIRPRTHLLKLGTMGEYGTPNMDIPEGFFEIEYKGKKDRLPFPRQAGSWYHWSKVHGSNNIMFASKIYGLAATDVMQGVVFGTRINGSPAKDARLWSRLDFDQAFGTAVNRFCCQAVIGHPITLYGRGHQKRGFLPLRDSMQCLTLALENPPKTGEYRVFNQFEEVHDLTELALKVQRAGRSQGLFVPISHLENPRMELEEHYYKPERKHLLELKYRPTHDLDSEIATILQDLLPHRDRIERFQDVLTPDLRWSGERRKVRTQEAPVPSNGRKIPRAPFTRNDSSLPASPSA
ncbi:MAG TPA: NAD-dependent epimerase/dehydratase family protein [Terriglobales bacterium]|jgi:UDP-sulfoquinovose synthase